MEEQVRGFKEAYKSVKRKGFQNYFCLSDTTWKQANERFKKGSTLKEGLYVMKLQENVNIILLAKGKKGLPVCAKCKNLFSNQEFRSGFKLCEHCEK